MSAQHYHAHAWGGVQADQYAGGDTAAASARALHPSSAQWAQSEAVWDDTEIPDQQFCMSTSSKTYMQCRAYKVKGEEHCIFHMRQFARRQAAEDGTDASGD